MSGQSITRRSARTEGPREKLERGGVVALSDDDLLALVLGHGTARASAAELSEALLARAGGVHGLIRLTPDEIRQTRGIGLAQASRVLAALELGRRTVTRHAPERPQFLTAEDAASYLLPRYGAFPVERFGLALLDTKHRLLRAQLLSIGSLDASLAHPRDLFRVAVGGGAASIVVFHNHPSGDPTPSHEDTRLTMRLASAGQVVGVPLLDHMILTDSRYYSYRRDGALRDRPL